MGTELLTQGRDERVEGADGRTVRVVQRSLLDTGDDATLGVDGLVVRASRIHSLQMFLDGEVDERAILQQTFENVFLGLEHLLQRFADDGTDHPLMLIDGILHVSPPVIVELGNNK